MPPPFSYVTVQFRYVQWHNKVIDVYNHHILNIRHQVMYYEDYSLGSRSVNQIVTFLEQPIRQAPLGFIEGKTYSGLFTDKDRALIANLIASLASPACWKLLQRYFEGWYEKPLALAKMKPPYTKVPIFWFLAYPQSVRIYRPFDLLSLSLIIDWRLSETGQ